MNAIWQMWESGISQQQIDSIIAICEKYEPTNATLGFTGEVDNNNYRKSELRWVGDNNEIKSLMWHFATEANRNAFGFDISYLNEIQYTIYKSEDQGKYDWHCDTFWGNPRMYDRKITVVIQLSDPSEYEGGLFEFDPQYEQPPIDALMKKGTVVVFPSFIQHRVTQLTSGTRKSIVAWIEGPKFR